ncbi:hypothetical protein [uncultured Tenacibaculum sp.]|uniref:hypothetical protein n=1 Tax=uncultured Tenacibaculum sp. TaxID=174713 RepID=UPI0026202C30|nr:hypothetical protein [uncultured Tenacibaculum sp.]
MKKRSISKPGKIVTKEKAKKAVKETGSFIAQNKKEILYVGGAILIGYVGYKIYKGISKGAEAVGDILENPEVDSIKTDLVVNPKNLTITNAQAEVFAKGLLDAFNHTILFGSPSSDKEKINKIFDAIKTGDDFRLIHKTFGYRKRAMGGTPTSYTGKKLSKAYDLTYWLKEEVPGWLNRSLYKKIEARFKTANIPF